MLHQNMGKLILEYGLLRWRPYLPGLFLLIAIPVLFHFKYPWDSHLYDVLLESGCLLVALAGFAIRALAIGYTPQRSSDVLLTKGIYSLLRHPLYAGNFFLGLAPVLFLHTWWLVLLYIIFFILYYQEIIKDETVHLEQQFGADYRNWAERTPAFFLRHFRWQRPDVPFSWKIVIRHEYSRFFGLIAVMAAMEHIGDVVVNRAFAIDTAWAAIFLAGAGFGVFVYLLFGLLCCALAVLFLFAGFPQKAMGQYHTPQAVSMSNGYDTQPLTFGQPKYDGTTPSFVFIPPPGYSRSFADTDMDEFPPVASENLTITRDSRTILLCNQEPSEPPRWDFSFPRCQSFNRSKPQIVEATRIDPSETWPSGCFCRTKGELGKIRSDFRNFYSRENFTNLLVGYGVHAVISNSSVDQNLRNWYQNHIRSSALNEGSAGVRDMGAHWAITPVAAVSVLYYSEKIADRIHFFDTRGGSVLGEFASRTTRAYLVGTPTMLVSQILIGAGRPNSLNPTSHWQPFVHANGVSGHAFVGALPLITLAQMSDNFWLKTGFYTCSTLTAWSRFNDDKHYFSQCLLGWYLAYLSCRAVSRTEYQLLPRGLTVFPIVESRTTGIGFVYQW